jgi:site-specific DNA recombinase
VASTVESPRDAQGNGKGVERQEEDCLAIAQRLGWTVVDRYIDNDTGASRYSKKVRKHYLRLLADIEARQLDAVVIWMEDRLQRQVNELAEFLKVCDQAGLTRIASAGGEKGERHLGGRRPYGEGWHGKQAVEAEQAAQEREHIREAVSRIIAGDSLRGIVVDWEKRGIRSQFGNYWRNVNLRTMLLSPGSSGCASTTVSSYKVIGSRSSQWRNGRPSRPFSKIQLGTSTNAEACRGICCPDSSTAGTAMPRCTLAKSVAIGSITAH